MSPQGDLNIAEPSMIDRADSAFHPLGGEGSTKPVTPYLSERDYLIVAKSNDIPINDIDVISPSGSLRTALQNNLLRPPRSSTHKSLTPAAGLDQSCEAQGYP